jgi:PadR family transcriptional regulator PadR
MLKSIPGGSRHRRPIRRRHTHSSVFDVDVYILALCMAEEHRLGACNPPQSPNSHYRMSISKIDRDIVGGLIRLHILHHASEGVIFGLGIIEELKRHGYKMSPGTLYPILHRFEEEGYLRAKLERAGSQVRRFYRATPRGRKALHELKRQVRELYSELFEHD